MRINFKSDYPVEYKTNESAGIDIYAAEDTVVIPHFPAIIPTSLYIKDVDFFGLPGDIPYLQLTIRSSLGAQGFYILNAPGIIDIDYRDEIKVIMATISKRTKEIKAGTRIAQLIPLLTKQVTGVTVNNVKRSGGLGSTGK